MDSSSQWLEGNWVVQYSTAVITIRTAIYRAAVWMSVSESYQSPNATSHSEIHGQDSNAGII